MIKLKSVFKFLIYTIVYLSILIIPSNTYSLSLSTTDMDLLTKNSIEEASIDGLTCMGWVTTVVLNRMSDSGFSASQVILWPKAFSWTSNKKKLNRTREDYPKRDWIFAQARAASAVMYWLSNPFYGSNGADHYARTDWIKWGLVDWAKRPGMFFRGTCGNHSFYEYMPTVYPDKRKRKVECYMRRVGQ